MAKAEAQAEAARNAEKAALKAAGRELERASREKAEAVAELERKCSEQKGRIAALEASLGRSRERLEKAKEMLGEAAKYKERAKTAERSLADERQRFMSAEREATAALQAEERRREKAAAEVADVRARLAREERACKSEKDALELEREAGKELEDAAQTAMVEVERLVGEREGMEKLLRAAEDQIATLRDEKSGAALSKEHAAVMDDQLRMIGALEKELGDATSNLAHAQARAEDAEKKNSTLAAENEKLKALLEEAVDRLPSGDDDAFDAAGAEATIEELRTELRAAEERAAVQLAAARSAARAAAAGEVAAAAKSEELAADLQTAARELEHEKQEHEYALDDARAEVEVVAAEAKMLRETNAELLSFMSELESASMDTAREGEAMAAQVEALKRELAAAKDALERFANAPAAEAAAVDEEEEPAALDAVVEEEEEEESETEPVAAARAAAEPASSNPPPAKKKEPTLKETKAKRASQSKPGRLGNKGPPPAKSAGASAREVAADDKENAAAGNGAFSVSALIASAGEWKPKTAKAAGGKRRQLGKQSAIRDSSVHENVLR